MAYDAFVIDKNALGIAEKEASLPNKKKLRGKKGLAAAEAGADAIAPRVENVSEQQAVQPLQTGAALTLAYCAAAPLLVAAVAIVARADQLGDAAVHFMALYGAALIVFFGGVRWGVAVMKPGGPTMKSLLGAAAPLALALPLFLPAPVTVKFPALMVLTIILLIDDLSATRRGSGAPAWYLGVRLPLTVLIEIAFLVALAALLSGAEV